MEDSNTIIRRDVEVFLKNDEISSMNESDGDFSPMRE
jgi:hypothetical protein